MEVPAGLTATTAIIGLGYAARQDRSLSFYSTVLVVIALGYVLFAVMDGAPRTIAIESAIAAVFIVVAVTATRWGHVRTAGVLMAGGLSAHGGTTSSIMSS
jgi:hypothetical protein